MPPESKALSRQCTCSAREDAAADRACPFHGDNGTMVILIRLDKHKRFLGFASKPVKP